MRRQRGTSRATLLAAALALAVVAVTAAGCDRIGTCGQELSPRPLVSVDVKRWIAAHPETNVRVCVDGDCVDGYNIVATYGDFPATPLHDDDPIAVIVQPIQGTSPVATFTTTAHLHPGECGQWGARLTLTSTGDITPAAMK